MGDPRWSCLVLKDYNPWKGPTLEQLLKDNSPWEGPTLEKVMKDILLWEASHAGAGAKCGEGVVETC